MLTYIVANWKMHKTQREIEEFAAVWKQEQPSVEGVQVIIAPSDPYLFLLSQQKMEGVAVAAQHIAPEEEGAYTGLMSAAQAADVGATYVLIGHSESRTSYHETTETIKKQLYIAKKYGLQPILCVGETQEEYDQGNTDQVITQEVAALLADFSQEEKESLIIAYEPQWAIGSGNTANIRHITHVHGVIKEQLGAHIPVLYGGSITQEELSPILAEKSVDGCLIGKASLDPHSFISLVKTAQNTQK